MVATSTRVLNSLFIHKQCTWEYLAHQYISGRVAFVSLATTCFRMSITKEIM